MVTYVEIFLVKESQGSSVCLSTLRNTYLIHTLFYSRIQLPLDNITLMTHIPGTVGLSPKTRAEFGILSSSSRPWPIDSSFPARIEIGRVRAFLRLMVTKSREKITIQSRQGI